MKNESLAVIGCGTMGHSIVLNAAWMGIPVTMYGLNKEEIERGLNGIKEKLEVMLQYQLIEAEDLERIHGKIRTTVSIRDITGEASFIIEAVPENLELKKSLFKELDRTCGEEVVLASNTSGLDPEAISSDMQHPERFIILHFWNPAHLVPLVEMAGNSKTNDTTEQRSRTLLLTMQKKPVRIKKAVPGFVGNRLQFALLREAQYLLENGIASKEDIDAAVVYGIGRRLTVTGPLLSADMGGLDIFASISDYLFRDLSDEKSASASIKELVAAHRLGQKNGEGYYKWDTSFSKKMNQEREAELIRLLKEDR